MKTDTGTFLDLHLLTNETLSFSNSYTINVKQNHYFLIFFFFSQAETIAINNVPLQKSFLQTATENLEV